MNALTGFVAMQVDRTIHSPRRLTVIVISLALIVASGLALLFQAAPPRTVVTYGIAGKVPTIAPIETGVCPGGVVHFPNVTFVEGGEAVSVSFANAWCFEGLAGGCVSVAPRADMPLLQPKKITNEKTALNVPATLIPGSWYYQHVATLSNDTASAYIVGPIEIISCPTESPEP